MRSLRSRLTLCFALLVGGLGFALGAYICTFFADRIATEVHRRGETLAHHLAEIGADAVVTEDRLALHALIRSVEKTETGIEYIYFADHDGDRVLADSFHGHFPPELLGFNRLPANVKISRMSLDLNGRSVYDIGAQVLEVRAGTVHLGLSAEPVERTVASLVTHTLIVVTLFTLAAILIARPVARSIARPLAELTEAVAAVGSGDHSKRLVPTRDDEIGALASAYNGMVDNLAATEKALKTQLAFREALLNDLPEAVYYKDTAGTLLGCSRAFAEFFGTTPAEVVGQKIDALLADPEQHRLMDTELIAGRGVVSYECSIRRHDGACRNIICFKTLFRDTEESEIIIGVMQDITREREADRLKSEFVSAVAHEFQTPLATVLGFAELILDRGISGEQRAEGLRQIMEKAERLSHLVDELLDLSRLETGRKFSLEPAPCDLREIALGVLDDFRNNAPDHQFTAALPADTLPLVGDAARLSQVLENLLSNAVKYSPKGTRIELRIARQCEGYTLAVCDQGKGMTREQLERAFDKFYRADTSNTAPAGTGLGLYLARSIVVMHGGDIRLDSQPGGGTCATVTLPFTPACAA